MMNAPVLAPVHYDTTKEAFVDVVCGLLSAIREHDAAKTSAKADIIDAYSNGEVTGEQAINLIKKYELETR